MILTAQLQTGFDVEVHLGGGWLVTALQGLIAAGVITAPPPAPPGTPISVTGVRILADDPAADLEIDVLVGVFPVTTLATLSLSADGEELLISTDAGFDTSVPFGVLSGLAGPPTLTKVAGTDAAEAAIVVLANLDVQAGDQSDEPDGEPIERGDPSLVAAFLPRGDHIAVGVGRSTFPRLANDVWHTELRADDGSHPLPDEDDRQGNWGEVEMRAENGRIRLELRGVVPITLWPDADVEITIDLTPRLVDGRLEFDIAIDSDVDTGVLGDLFAFLGGGLIGLVIGSIFGAALAVAGIVAVLGVIVLEVAEAIVEGVVTREIRARFDQQPVSVLSCDDEIVVSAIASEDGAIALRVLDAIPRSIPIHEDFPDPLHRRFVLVTSDYREVVVDLDGFGVSGVTRIVERFQPVSVQLVGRTRTADDSILTELSYVAGGTAVTVDLDDALARAGSGALAATTLRVIALPPDATTTIPDGTLAAACLQPDAIRRLDTVITDVHFTTGLDLKVAEAVRLQEASVLVLEGLQLIRPSNANPYYRSPANDTTADNFENLPDF